MYSTCMFCHDDLGRNAAIEHFPIGRRLAYDAAKGRLWVVCRKCERWNLTPLEERWEAIDECEREFRGTRLRVSTEHIGLARLKEGMELVRIGEPQRPEMAAWRYGDQFGRRRRRHYALFAGATVAAAGVLIAGPMLGLIGAGAVSPVINVLSTGSSIYKSRTKIQVPTANGVALRVSLTELPRTELHADGDGVLLRIFTARNGKSPAWWKYDSGRGAVELSGDDALRAAGALLPSFNAGGGSRNDVAQAVSYLEESADPKRLMRRAVGLIERREGGMFNRDLFSRHPNLLKNLPIAGRLALEMAAHEDSERRALEGELHILEAAWQQAEEIAGIADDMFLPSSIDADLARLKRDRA